MKRLYKSYNSPCPFCNLSLGFYPIEPHSAHRIMSTLQEMLFSGNRDVMLPLNLAQREPSR